MQFHVSVQDQAYLSEIGEFACKRIRHDTGSARKILFHVISPERGHGLVCFRVLEQYRWSLLQQHLLASETSQIVRALSRALSPSPSLFLLRQLECTRQDSVVWRGTSVRVRVGVGLYHTSFMSFRKRAKRSALFRFNSCYTGEVSQNV